MKWLLKSLLKDLLIMVALLAATAILPVLAFSLCRTPWGAQLVWWCGPWTCAVWALFIVQLGGSRFWRGAGAVRAWREAHGGLLMTSLRGTGWMFAALFLSYGCELAAVFLLPPSPVIVHAFPLFTYAPLIPAVWRAARG